MAKRCFLMTILLFACVLFAAGESQAVIYKYVNEKGVPTFADDLQKVPEQFRASAVVVSGVVVDEKAEQEKARQEAEAQALKAKQAQKAPVAPKPAEDSVGKRLIRSGVAVGVFVALLFVLSNIHGLQEQARLLSRIRIMLVLLLFVFLGFTHATDIAGIFGGAGQAVKNPITQLQEESAAKGKKAADAYKAMDKILEQRVSEEKAKLEEMEKKLEDAEKGK